MTALGALSSRTMTYATNSRVWARLLLTCLCPEVNEHLIFKYTVKSSYSPHYTVVLKTPSSMYLRKIWQQWSSCVNYTCEVYYA